MANETTHGQGQNNQKLTLEIARAKLAGQTGKKYWRSVDELADTPAFREALQREFPAQAAEWIDPVSRRGFLKVMGASLALAGLSGCTKQPDEEIYPYVKEPEDLVLGRPVYFATAFPFPTGAVPLLVKSDAYRPIKVDGNPEHPVNRGSSVSCRLPGHACRQEGKRGRWTLHFERHGDLAYSGGAMEDGAAELSQCQVVAVGPD
jgi:molybdopterin-containing oxidoreductase family iron-sulfur binding subunit